jgi:hypothetical protein
MNNGASNPGNKDYLDKGLESVERKFGGAQGNKLAGNRNMNEKIVRTPLPVLTHLPPIIRALSSHTVANVQQRPMAHATSSKNSPAKKCPASSPTKPVPAEDSTTTTTMRKGSWSSWRPQPGWRARWNHKWNTKIRPTFERLNGLM